MDVGLQIPIEIFIWIEFWRVGRNKAQLNRILMLRHPGLHLPAVMHAEIIRNEVDLAVLATDQAG